MCNWTFGNIAPFLVNHACARAAELLPDPRTLQGPTGAGVGRHDNTPVLMAL